MPRGRYALDAADLVLGDPFGLAEARIALERHDTLLVYPRVFDLDGVFTDAGAAGGDEGRALLHRTAGYDLHSIRDFQQGESLRRVHWRSTAKRRKLMVKELTETPRDEAAVEQHGGLVARRLGQLLDHQLAALGRRAPVDAAQALALLEVADRVQVVARRAAQQRAALAAARRAGIGEHAVQLEHPRVDSSVSRRSSANRATASPRISPSTRSAASSA